MAGQDKSDRSENPNKLPWLPAFYFGSELDLSSAGLDCRALAAASPIKTATTVAPAPTPSIMKSRRSNSTRLRWSRGFTGFGGAQGMATSSTSKSPPAGGIGAAGGTIGAGPTTGTATGATLCSSVFGFARGAGRSPTSFPTGIPVGAAGFDSGLLSATGTSRTWFGPSTRRGNKLK